MTDRLRIVSVCRSLPTPTDPSAGIFVLNRIEAMSRVADIRVVQPIPYCPGVRPLPEWAQEPHRRLGSLVVHHAPMLYVPGVLKSLDGFWLARSIAHQVSAMHRDRPVDALDAHFGFPDGAGCWRVGNRLGIPVFITLRGFEQERVRLRVIGAELVNAMRKATGCVAVSHSLQEMAILHSVDPRRVHVIQNAVDASLFSPGESEDSRRRLGVSPKSRLLVSVGHLIRRKRHHVLLEAFAALRKEFPDAMLAIIGARADEPDYPELLASSARSLGVQEHVRFVGNVPQNVVVDWLRAADVFTLLTAREGCCNAVLEALAVGVPVVTTAAGDNAEFVKSGENGAIVPIDDAHATAQAVVAALHRRDWNRERISADLRAKVGSWQVVAERVIEFFNARLASDGEQSRQSLAGRRGQASA